MLILTPKLWNNKTVMQNTQYRLHIAHVCAKSLNCWIHQTYIQLYTQSKRTGNLVITENYGNCNFFANRVVKYWNKLPENIKFATNVNLFKNRPYQFRNKYFNNTYKNGQFWELSLKIFERIGFWSFFLILLLHLTSYYIFY